MTIEPIEHEKTLEQNSGENLYQALMSRYSLAVERNNAYITKAQFVLGLAGLFVSILVTILVSAIANEEVRKLLQSLSYIRCFKSIIIINFIVYFISIIYSLITFNTNKYMPIPQVNSKSYIDDIFDKKVNFSLKLFSKQTFKAIEFYDNINESKYKSL